MLNHDVYVSSHTRLDGCVRTANKRVNGIESNGSTRVIVTLRSCQHRWTRQQKARGNYYGVAAYSLSEQPCTPSGRRSDARNVYLVYLDVYSSGRKVRDTKSRTSVAGTRHERTNQPLRCVCYNNSGVTTAWAIASLAPNQSLKRPGALQICCRFHSRSLTDAAFASLAVLTASGTPLRAEARLNSLFDLVLGCFTCW